jgi:hypothetical protein
MSRAQILSGAAQTSGLDEAVLEDLLDRLYLDYPDQVPDDWAVTHEWLVTQSVPTEQADALIAHLKELQSGAAELGPRVILDDPALRGATEQEPHEQAPASAPEWVAPGSAIYCVGDEFYLGEGHQVWQISDGGQPYFHDGTDTFDAMGNPFTAAEPAGTEAPRPDPVEPGSRILRIGDEFHLDGDHQVWQATDGGRTYYHDGTNTYDALGNPLQAAQEASAEPAHEEVAAQTVEEVRPALAAAIAAVPGAEHLSQEDIQDVLARVAGTAPAAH